MKRILFFINTLNTGGAERVLTDLVGLLPMDQYSITVQTVLGGTFRSDLPQHVCYRQIIPFRGRLLSRLCNKLFNLLPPGLSARLFFKKGYDIEIAYLEGIPTKVIAARNTLAKKVAFVHFDMAGGNLISPVYPDNETCLKEYASFDRVCFVSPRARESFLSVIGDPGNTAVFLNPVNTHRILEQAAAPTEYTYATDGMKLISVGRAEEVKGFDRLIRICAELEKEFNFELLILGDGSAMPQLKTMIQKLGVTSVRLLGMQRNPYAYMRQADLYVCSSRSEAYSTVISEALSLALPVITTDCAGMDKLLENGRCGMIVENTEEALKQGLRALLRDRAAYEGLKDRAAEKQAQLLVEQPAAEYLKLFDSLTEK